MLSVGDALRAVIAKVSRLPTETVPLARARGRILAGDLLTTRPLPGFDNSAMDGYAARSHELPGALLLAGVSAAGAAHAAAVPERSTIRIFTGAPIPPELDTVVIQEDATIEGDRIALPAAAPGDHVRRTGEDFAVGDRVLSAGTRLTAWDLGVLAALGIAEVSVSRAPRVAVIATGDELVELGSAVGPGQLIASSTHALCALLEELGCTTTALPIVRDEVAPLARLLASLDHSARLATSAPPSLDHDVVITTGGVSVGDRDQVKAAFAAAGIELEVSKVAMKPGKPFSFGRKGALSIFGLPGNPVSTLVGFELFVRPALLAMQGAATLHRPRVPVLLPRSYKKPAGRAHYLRARLARDGEHLIAHVHPKQGSAMLSSLIGCNALVEIAAELTEVSAGSLAPALLLDGI